MRPWEFAQLAVPGLFLPLTTIFDHPGYVTREYRVLLLGLGVSLTTIGLAALLTKLGMERKTSVHVMTLLALGATQGGQVAAKFPGGTLSVVALLSVATVAVFLLGSARPVTLGMTWLTLTLWLWIGAGAVQSLLDYGESLIPDRESVVAQIDPPGGDVVVAIFDEYPNAEFAASELDIDMSAHVSALEGSGFEVHSVLPGVYSFTELAVPSFFMLDLPSGEGDITSPATRSDLSAVTGGDSPFVRAFKDVGYQVTVVESGWPGMRCMSTVDECVARPWYDEATAAILSSSLLRGPLVRSLGHPFSLGAERVMDWATTTLPSMTADPEDDLIIVHFMLPHAPFAFDARCERTETVEEEPTALRKQVECANRLMVELAGAVSDDTFTILMGDHGTTSQGQIQMPVEDWTADMTAERMNTFAAVKGLSDCAEPLPTNTTNLAVRFLRCLGDERLPYVPDTHLATSVEGEPLAEVRP